MYYLNDLSANKPSTIDEKKFGIAQVAEEGKGPVANKGKFTNKVEKCLQKNEPKIYKALRRADNEKIEVYYFSLKALLSDLFEEVKEKDGCEGHNKLINLKDFPDNKIDRFNYFLPDSIIKEIEEQLSSNEKNKNEKNNPYNFIFNSGGSNCKLNDAVHKVFANDGKDFILQTQKHIVTKLSDAKINDMNNLCKYLSDSMYTFCPDASGEIIDKVQYLLSFNEKDEIFESPNKESISLVIANYYLSSLLGLWPLHVEGGSENRGIYRKAYLLNELGMKYIWMTEKITDQYSELLEYEQLFKNGYYKHAVGKVTEWLNKYEEVPNEHLASAYKILGLSIYKLSIEKHIEFEGQQSEGINYLEKSVDTGKADLYVHYFLYEYYKTNNYKKAISYLQTAYNGNYGKAIVEVAFDFLKKKELFDITENELLNKINIIINNQSINEQIDVGNCYYLRGLFAKEKSNLAQAESDFEAAARRGNENASLEISYKKRTEWSAKRTFLKNSTHVPCCFANTLTGNNLATLSTFPEEAWELYTPGETYSKNLINAKSMELDEFLKLCNFEENMEFCFPRIVFLFMSEDDEKNLNESLCLLDKLFNYALRLPDDKKFEMIDQIDIYLGAKYETASMLVDASINDMGKGIYFKVHIIDKSRDTVHKLLCDAPLFLPALNGVKKENFTNVVLLGDSELNYRFIKESIACAYLGNKHLTSITLLGENADRLEKRFHQECPGICKGNQSIACIKPKFIQCNIKEADFPSYIYGSAHDRYAPVAEKSDDENLDSDIVNVLRDGNYFIVDFAEDDFENIRFASELRTWLMRSRGTFDRTPFIAVKCSNDQNSYLARRLTLSGQTSGNSYFNKYDLFPIGVARQNYSYQNIIENPVLINFALKIHKSYYGDDIRAAENDFYSYSYNADSSLLMAIGLCYRFFAAEVAFDEKDKYLDYGFFISDDIVSRFITKINNDNELIEKLAILEQSRWNGFMLSRGWESANESQVQAYKEQSTGFAHKHTLAKMHPFIKEWDELDDPKLEQVLGILKSKFDYDKKPKETTIKSIKDTAKFFQED